MKKKREIIHENGQTFLLNTRGSKYLVEGHNVYHGPNKKCVLERLDFPKMPISDFGFKRIEELKELLIQLVAEELNIPIETMNQMFETSNNVHMLNPLYDDWDKYRNCNALYSNPHYLLETLHCSLYVTAEFHRKRNNLGQNCIVENVLRNLHVLDFYDKELHIGDWGAGLGLTSIWMAKALPKAKIYYIEINQQSINIFKKLKERFKLNNLIIINKLEDLPKLDVAVCIEYIEHIPSDIHSDCGDVMKATDEVLSYTNDNGLIMYSTKWNEVHARTSLGHFSQYDFDGEIIPITKGTKKPHKAFGKCMKKRGWHVQNGSPASTLFDFKPHRPYVYSKTKRKLKQK